MSESFKYFLYDISRLKSERLHDSASNDDHLLVLNNQGLLLNKLIIGFSTIKHLCNEFKVCLNIHQNKVGSEEKNLLSRIRNHLTYVRRYVIAFDGYLHNDCKLIIGYDETLVLFNNIDEYIKTNDENMLKGFSLSDNLDNFAVIFDSLLSKAEQIRMNMILKLREEIIDINELAVSLSNVLLSCQKLCFCFLDLLSDDNIIKEQNVFNLVITWINNFSEYQQNISASFLQNISGTYEIINTIYCKIMFSIMTLYEILNHTSQVNIYINIVANVSSLLYYINNSVSIFDVETVSKTIKRAFSAYINNEPLGSIFSEVHNLFKKQNHKIKMFQSLEIYQEIVESYDVLNKIFEEGYFEQEAMLSIILCAFRLVACIFPNGILTEEILLSIKNFTSVIIKSIYNESFSRILDLENILNMNFECFPSVILESVKHSIQIAKGIDVEDFASNGSLTSQQLFFNCLGSFNYYILELTRNCCDKNINDKLLAIGIEFEYYTVIFGRWLFQSYNTVNTIIFHKSALFYHILSFNININDNFLCGDCLLYKRINATLNEISFLLNKYKVFWALDFDKMYNLNRFISSGSAILADVSGLIGSNIEYYLLFYDSYSALSSISNNYTFMSTITEVLSMNINTTSAFGFVIAQTSFLIYLSKLYKNYLISKTHIQLWVTLHYMCTSFVNFIISRHDALKSVLYQFSTSLYLCVCNFYENAFNSEEKFVDLGHKFSEYIDLSSVTMYAFYKHIKYIPGPHDKSYISHHKIDSNEMEKKALNIEKPCYLRIYRYIIKLLKKYRNENTVIFAEYWYDNINKSIDPLEMLSSKIFKLLKENVSKLNENFPKKLSKIFPLFSLSLVRLQLHCNDFISYTSEKINKRLIKNLFTYYSNKDEKMLYEIYGEMLIIASLEKLCSFSFLSYDSIILKSIQMTLKRLQTLNHKLDVFSQGKIIVNVKTIEIFNSFPLLHTGIDTHEILSILYSRCFNENIRQSITDKLWQIYTTKYPFMSDIVTNISDEDRLSFLLKGNIKMLKYNLNLLNIAKVTDRLDVCTDIFGLLLNCIIIFYRICSTSSTKFLAIKFVNLTTDLIQNFVEYISYMSNDTNSNYKKPRNALLNKIYTISNFSSNNLTHVVAYNEMICSFHPIIQQILVVHYNTICLFESIVSSIVPSIFKTNVQKIYTKNTNDLSKLNKIFEYYCDIKVEFPSRKYKYLFDKIIEFVENNKFEMNCDTLKLMLNLLQETGSLINPIIFQLENGIKRPEVELTYDFNYFVISKEKNSIDLLHEIQMYFDNLNNFFINLTKIKCMCYTFTFCIDIDTVKKFKKDSDIVFQNLSDIFCNVHDTSIYFDLQDKIYSLSLVLSILISTLNNAFHHANIDKSVIIDYICKTEVLIQSISSILSKIVFCYYQTLGYYVKYTRNILSLYNVKLNIYKKVMYDKNFQKMELVSDLPVLVSESYNDITIFYFSNFSLCVSIILEMLDTLFKSSKDNKADKMILNATSSLINVIRMGLLLSEALLKDQLQLYELKILSLTTTLNMVLEKFLTILPSEEVFFIKNFRKYTNNIINNIKPIILERYKFFRDYLDDKTLRNECSESKDILNILKTKIFNI